MKLSHLRENPLDRLNFWTAVTVLAILLILLFIVYPFSHLLIRSFVMENGSISFAHYAEFFQSKYYLHTLFNSFMVSASATVLALLIGLPMAYFTARYRIIGKSIVDHLCILAMLSPPFIGAYSWIVLLGRAGVFTRFAEDTFGLSLPSMDFRGFYSSLRSSCFPMFISTFRRRCRAWTPHWRRRRRISVQAVGAASVRSRFPSSSRQFFPLHLWSL